MSSNSSRFAKTAKKTVRRGVSLYKFGASPYWYARIWSRSTAKYIVRSTKETSRIVAAEVAEELYSDLKKKKFLDDVPRAKTFIFFAEKLINQQRRLAGKTRSVAFASDDEKLLKRKNDGIIDYFYKRDISLIRTSDISHSKPIYDSASMLAGVCHYDNKNNVYSYDIDAPVLLGKKINNTIQPV